MMVDNDSFLIDLKASVIDFTDTDTSDILIVIDRTDQNLCIGIRVTGWCRNVIYNCLEERRHILLLIVEIVHCVSVSCGCVDERAVKLLV